MPRKMVAGKSARTSAPPPNFKAPKETPPSSTSNTSASNDDNSPEAAPPPTKRMTLEAPVAQEKQPEPVEKQKQPMNVVVRMQDLAKTAETNYNQFKQAVDRLQKHGTHNFVITDEFIKKMKEISEKTSALNALIPDSVNINPIRKRIQLTLKNCRELFTKDDFCVLSTSIELVGFTWKLVASPRKEKGFLGLFLQAKLPTGFKGNYQIEVDFRITILNALTDNNLIAKDIGLYIMKEIYPSGYGKGFLKMAKLEDLLDPAKAFLTPDGDIETCVDFTIKSSTLYHLK